MLHRVAPDCTLRPIAIDRDRAWSLLPDGGAPLSQSQANLPAPAQFWSELLQRFAALQHQASAHVDEMRELGVPDLRPKALPRRLEQLVESSPALDADARRSLSALGQRFAELCAALEESGIAPSLNHGDLHEGNVFVGADGRHIFFDWGDAGLAHPFSTLLTAHRVIRKRMNSADADLVIERSTGAHLELWSGAGLSTR